MCHIQSSATALGLRHTQCRNAGLTLTWVPSEQAPVQSMPHSWRTEVISWVSYQKNVSLA